MIEATAVSVIKDVGFPIAAFLLMYALYVHNQKWQQKQQDKTEARFDNLTRGFTAAIKEITDAHNKAMERHTEALERNNIKLEEHTAMLQEHVRIKDEFMVFIKEDRKYHIPGVQQNGHE